MLPEICGLIHCIVIGCVIIFKHSHVWHRKMGFAPCCCTYKR